MTDIRGASGGGRVVVLDADPDLAAGLAGERVEHARAASVAGVIAIPAGPWEVRGGAESIRSGYGLLALDGLLIRRVGLSGRYGAELLGAGDLLRPWAADGEAIPAPAFETSWRAFSPSRFAVLDHAWASRMAPYPQVGAELAGRALTRSRRLVAMMAIAQHPRLEDRLWLHFCELAGRFGRVHADGVHIDLPLTHEVLSHLAAARRPSVSGALSRLAELGRVRRAGRGWVLVAEPGVDAAA
jgi:CRP/FNR family cyclic AMP-dependent transcriptional regulator